MGRSVYKDIEIRGEVFPTVRAAADHFGLNLETIYAAMKKGTLHRVGTGAVGAEPCPVRIRGQVYASAKEAASALGVTPGAIHTALMNGRIDKVGIRPTYRNAFRSRQIKLGPVTFHSMAAADRALGFSPGYIAHTLKNKRRCAVQRIIAAAMTYEGKRMVS